MIPASLDIATLAHAYASGELHPTALVEDLLARMDRCPLPNIWIHRLDPENILAQARQLEKVDPGRLPLYGIPFAVKDNIDVAHEPTTVGCPDFTFVPEASAAVVELLTAAGAILVGKTNLDQFATGLVGTRSPYGPVPNPFDPAYISGGSSSGSAVAVAAGLVSFALGTDTAGSGRIPAAFCNVVGLKPSRGLISARGVFPACRSLDCVSIFALTVDDAQTVLQACARFDPQDAYARPAPPGWDACAPPGPFRFGLPQPHQRQFFGDTAGEARFAEAIQTLEASGGQAVLLDFAPFMESASLLYQGPWVAERLVAVQPFIHEQPDALLPVIRAIIAGGADYSAADLFRGHYRLQELRRQVEPLWQQMDLLVVPTAGTIYTQAQVAAAPIALNNDLGTYTNFANLLDLCALALPNGFRPDRLPVGITLLAPAFLEHRLTAIGAAFARRRQLPLGATGNPYPTVEPCYV